MSRRQRRDSLVNGVISGILSKNPGVAVAFVLGVGLSYLSLEIYRPQWLSSAGPGKMNVCFTPGQNCTDLIIQEIRKAQKSIQVQAFSFTSPPLSEALVEAHHRGVKVIILLDKWVKL